MGNLFGLENNNKQNTCLEQENTDEIADDVLILYDDDGDAVCEMERVD